MQGADPAHSPGSGLRLLAQKVLPFLWVFMPLVCLHLPRLRPASRLHGKPKKNAVLAIIDTRRGSLFFQAFDAHGKPRSDIIDGQPEDAAALIKASSESWCLAGHGADAIRARCPDHDITVAEKTSPDAHGLILQFSAMQAQHIALDDDHLEPLYLAAPILGPKKSAPKTAEKTAGKIEASS